MLFRFVSTVSLIANLFTDFKLYSKYSLITFFFFFFLLRQDIENFKKNPLFWEEKKMLVAQLYLTLCNTMACSPPGSSVHRIFQAKNWSGQPFPSLGDLPNPGMEPGSLALQVDSLSLSHQGSLYAFKVNEHIALKIFLPKLQYIT